ncbi:outer membrane protein [Methylocystis bryophila]|uniref:Outer membrane protein beta-barrel domain-containing protein n=1 Tax=Methylocystis bryophila TaxID=655015 RepID=A0A1W6N1D8_9HYPH|nr:outer membrane beta-barrel protein [Methylocystis bryophila]ARN83682.1 hypothetical protein B1812_15180 [Methylocystis bryophila]
MKRPISLFLALSATCGAAQAADLPSRKSAPPPYLVAPVPTWTGFYAGVNIGGGVPVSGTGGVLGGGQLGYNYQFTPLFVAGLEADFQGSSIGGGSSSFGGPMGGERRSVDWFGTVRGRVGTIAIDPKWLIYGTGGFAYGGNGSAETGWTGGGGVEYAFAPNWSARAEYLFVDLSGGGGYGPNHSNNRGFHVIRAGLNYRFDPFTSSTWAKSF